MAVLRTGSNMNDQAFQLLRDDLAEIKSQNTAQLALMQSQNIALLERLADHEREDRKVHRVVDRHSVYFSFFSLGIPTAVAYITKKLGLY